MTTLDFTQVELGQLITHHVGNKLRDEKYSLSKETSVIDDETVKFLLKYFLLSLKLEEFYCFTHSVDLERNDIYSTVVNLFLNTDNFIETSQNIAKLLYEYSNHPKIKGGELNIALFSNIILNDDIIQGIGIFKSETNIPFIQMKQQKNKFSINHDYGFEIKGVDKGCMIFNTAKNDGYRILIIDNVNKSIEAQYWKDEFLEIKPIANEFHQTNQFLGIAKQFVTKHLPKTLEVTKTDQIDLLNRSVDYFKSHNQFDKQEFENEVFANNNIIDSFKKFDRAFKQENELELSDTFEISPQAVKKQARVFKSVLKLDKNFEIYIHGNRELIEQGVDDNGRKFYKIYYENEN